MNAFLPANILLPKTDHMEKWAVIACDQFTSNQAYWDRVRKNARALSPRSTSFSLKLSSALKRKLRTRQKLTPP